MLRSIPGLEVIAKSFLGQSKSEARHVSMQSMLVPAPQCVTMGIVSHAGPAAEQVLLLENIATSIKIGPDQLPSVHKLLIEAAQVLEMDPPELYVRQARGEAISCFENR